MPQSLQRLGTASVLFLVCLGCYIANRRTVSYDGSFDTIPTRLLPFSILRYQSITLEPFRQDFLREQRHEGFTLERRGTLISGYPIGASFLALPFYFPYYVNLAINNKTSHSDLFARTESAEKLAASLIAALSVAVLFLIIAPRVGGLIAVIIAMTFGLGTLIWASASQQLWQHGPGVLCLLLALLGLYREPQSRRTRIFTGFWLGLAFAIRPQTIPFLAAGAAAEWLITEGPVRARARALIPFCLGALPLVAFTMAYNFFFFGSPAGSYQPYESRFHLSFLVKGGPALLFSPNRGLLIFSPIALIGVFGMAFALRRPRAHPIEAAFTAAAIVYFVLHASFFTWAAGWSFGPRYLIETLPALALASTLAISRLPASRAAAIVIVLAIGWSVLVEWNGAFCYPASNWNGRMASNLEGHAWDFCHIELWEDFKSWRAKMRKRVEPHFSYLGCCEGESDYRDHGACDRREKMILRFLAPGQPENRRCLLEIGEMLPEPVPGRDVFILVERKTQRGERRREKHQPPILLS
jgi:hypothetical protein